MLKNLLSGLTSPTKATVVEANRQSPQKPAVFMEEQEVKKKEDDDTQATNVDAEETKDAQFLLISEDTKEAKEEQKSLDFFDVQLAPTDEEAQRQAHAAQTFIEFLINMDSTQRRNLSFLTHLEKEN